MFVTAVDFRDLVAPLLHNLLAFQANEVHLPLAFLLTYLLTMLQGANLEGHKIWGAN